MRARQDPARLTGALLANKGGATAAGFDQPVPASPMPKPARARRRRGAMLVALMAASAALGTAATFAYQQFAASAGAAAVIVVAKPTVTPPGPVRTIKIKPPVRTVKIKPPVRTVKIKPPPQPPRYRVQLAALATQKAVLREWLRMRRSHGDLFGGLRMRVVAARAGTGGKTHYPRALGARVSKAAALGLCRRVRLRRLDCLVVKP